jgi:hypothetical protein
VKTTAAHKTKSELKTVKAMVQSRINARGAASLLEKNARNKYTAKQVAHIMKKIPGRIRQGHSRGAKLVFEKYHFCYETNRILDNILSP